MTKKERLRLARKCKQLQEGTLTKPTRKPRPRPSGHRPPPRFRTKEAYQRWMKKYGRFSNFTYDDLENIVDTMPTDEKTTLALGFYNYDDAVADEIFELDFDGDEEFNDFTDYVDDDFAYQSFDEDEDDDFDNVVTDGTSWIGAGDEDFLEGDDDFDGYRPRYKKKIRGGGKNAFELKGSHHINFNEDGEIGLEGGDEEFDNLLSKKGRKRRKLRRKKRKEYKKSGMSRKEARKKARKEARKEIPRDTLKETAKKSWKKIKKGVKAVGKVLKKGAFFIPKCKRFNSN